MLLLLLCSLSQTFALNDIYINRSMFWVMGEGLYIDFNNQKLELKAIESDENPIFASAEGSAAISDKNGNLLFYTDGIRVWNNEHRLANMPDGNMLSNTSTTQSSIILPNPKNDSLYFIFSLINIGRPEGVSYSVFNPYMDNRKGTLITTNINLLDSIRLTEKMAAVLNADNNGFWLLLREWLGRRFVSISVDSIAGSKMIYSDDSELLFGGASNTAGYLKANFSGDMIASASMGQNLIELAKFDNNSGEFGEIVVLKDSNYGSPYGVEFSRSGQYLFVTYQSPISKVVGYEISSFDAEAILNSAFELSESELPNLYGALQNAPDGKIYIVKNNSNSMDCITMPNQPFIRDRYLVDAIEYEGEDKVLRFGLPNFANVFLHRNLECGETIFANGNLNKNYKFSKLGNIQDSEQSIILTQASDFQTSAFWIEDKFSMKQPFSAVAHFKLSNGNNRNIVESTPPGADGLALVFQDFSKNAIGEEAGYLGYSGIPKSIAIEIDCFINDETDQIYDPPYDHIAVQSAGEMPNTASHKEHTITISETPFPIFARGEEYFLFVDYDWDKNLSVSLSKNRVKPEYPLITIQDFDFSKDISLDKEQSMWFGITATTGNAFQKTEILGLDICATKSSGNMSAELTIDNDSAIKISYTDGFILANFQANEVIISNYLGQIIGKYKSIQNESNNSSFNIKSLRSGVYIVSFMNSDSQIYTTKLLIE